MVFISIAAATALMIGTALGTPLAEGGQPGNEFAKRANVVCESNNAVLQALRSPQVSSQASVFCSLYIQSSTSTTVTTTATTHIATQTTTPATVVIPETTTQVTTTTVTANAVAKRGVTAESPLPSYVAKFKPDRVSSACSCIVTADTTTSTITATDTVSDTATATAETPTTTATTTVSKVETVIEKPACATAALRNGNFENGAAPWRYEANSPNAAISYSDQAHDGSRAIYARCGGAGGNGPISFSTLEQILNTCPGMTYDVSVWYKIYRASPNVYFNAFVDGNYIVSVRAFSPDTLGNPIGQWAQVRGSFKATGSTAVLRFHPTCTNYENDEFLIDDVVITPRL